MNTHINPISFVGIVNPEKPTDKEKVTVEEFSSSNFESAMKIVCEEWKVEKEMLMTRTRKREVVEARMVLMEFRRDIMKLRQHVATGYFGLEHGAVIHAKKTISNLKQTNREFRERYTNYLNKRENINNV